MIAFACGNGGRYPGLSETKFSGVGWHLYDIDTWIAGDASLDWIPGLFHMECINVSAR